MGNVKQNFKRSCLNLGMVIAIVVPLGIFFVSLYDGGILGRNMDMDLLSAYATPMALSNYVQFACLFPILPFAFSFCEDKNSGYLQYIRLRLSEKSYIQEKMFWTGVSGGIAATIPSMILFLVLICCYHPASNMPDSMYYPSHLQGMMWEKYIGVWGGILILRSDFYPKYMECQKPLGDPIQFKSAYFTEDICMKAILLNNVKTIQEISKTAV